jgi:hypothetical protein
VTDVGYDGAGKPWFDFPGIRIPFDPKISLVPLFGHTNGHRRIAVRTGAGSPFHVGDTAPWVWRSPLRRR